MLKVGEPVPNFSTMAFKDDDFEEVSLDDYDGQWKVLFFYPGDFTFV